MGERIERKERRIGRGYSVFVVEREVQWQRACEFFGGAPGGGRDGGDPCKLRRRLTIFELPKLRVRYSHN